MSVLVFPPFLGKYRYLAHKIVDDYFFPELCSFSIGEEDSRRTLVGSSDNIFKCSLPFKCIHEKLKHISETWQKETDCVCSVRKQYCSTTSEKLFSITIKSNYEIMKNLKSNEKMASSISDSESSKETPSLRDRRKRPDKQLYVPRALRNTKESSVSENIKDKPSQNGLHCILFENSETQSMSAMNDCSSLRTNRKTSISAKEVCISDRGFHDVPFEDTVTQNVSDENDCFLLKTKKDPSVSAKDELSESKSNFHNESFKNSESDLNCYPSNSKDMISQQVDDPKKNLNSLELLNETLISSQFVPKFQAEVIDFMTKDPVVEKQDSIHLVHFSEDKNKSLGYSEENSASHYQPIDLPSGVVEDSKFLNECTQELSDFVQKEITVKEVLHKDPSVNISQLNEVLLENSNNINLNTNATNVLDISVNNQHCDSKSFDNARQKSDIPISEEDSWETMFNDEGECLDPELVNEISKVTGRMQIRVAKNSYSDYRPISEATSSEYDNIVELYAFPVEFKTQDLVSSLSTFQHDAYTIKWVDDCHALAVFTSPALANQALQLSSQFIKIRPLSDGTKESKAKARLCSHQLEPCRPRPATSAALARRLVSGALGLKNKVSKEQRDLERNMLKEAKERKKLKAKQRQDIWDGVVL